MEIGSEFWKKSKQYIKDNEEVYLSGRTALDVIVRDAIKNHGITSALMPSYCCQTMIEPFIDNGVSVRFYDVYVDEEGKLVADVPSPNNNELLYIMKYFGDTDLLYKGAGKTLKGWCTTVEDLTHSCFDGQYETKAEYWFISYRKWFAVDGVAIAGKREGKLPPAQKGSNIEYCKFRNDAFAMKAEFIEGQSIDKQHFLNIFSEAEQVLSKDYKGYGARPDSIVDLCSFIDNLEQIREKRRENAYILLDGVAEINEIKTFIDFKDSAKCPLFVPIIVASEDRDTLRKYLIERDIYCPVHWPTSNLHTGLTERAKAIYGEEISLVCDQRYSTKDMNREVQAITEFFRDR